MEKILFIEDDKKLRKTVTEILDLYDFYVLSAENGIRGYQLLIEEKPDLIISDIMMPGMDGIELLKKVRCSDTFSSIPFILLTAKSMVEDKIEGLELGADDYITKPFNSKELVLRIKALLTFRKKIQNDTVSKPFVSQNGNNSAQFLLKLASIVEKYINDPSLGLKRIAKEAALSPSGLQKKLKQINNKTVSQFVREYRLEKARQLLQQNNTSITEIARMVGFSTVSYFSTAYKKLFGESPKDHRKRM